MRKVEIFTDGSFRKKGSVSGSGYAIAMKCDGHMMTLSEPVKGATINQMELQAVITALNSLVEPCDVTIHSDSRYVVDGATKWLHGWKRNNWKTKQGTDVANKEYWEEINKAYNEHKINLRWCKAHTNKQDRISKANAVVDELAQNASDIALAL